MGKKRARVTFDSSARKAARGIADDSPHSTQLEASDDEDYNNEDDGSPYPPAAAASGRRRSGPSGKVKHTCICPCRRPATRTVPSNPVKAARVLKTLGLSSARRNDILGAIAARAGDRYRIAAEHFPEGARRGATPKLRHVNTATRGARFTSEFPAGTPVTPLLPRSLSDSFSRLEQQFASPGGSGAGALPLSPGVDLHPEQLVDDGGEGSPGGDDGDDINDAQSAGSPSDGFGADDLQRIRSQMEHLMAENSGLRKQLDSMRNGMNNPTPSWVSMGPVNNLSPGFRWDHFKNASSDVFRNLFAFPTAGLFLRFHDLVDLHGALSASPLYDAGRYGLDIAAAGPVQRDATDPFYNSVRSTKVGHEKGVGGRSRKLSTKDMLLLTMYILRTGSSYLHASIMFGLPQHTISAYFLTCMTLLDTWFQKEQFCLPQDIYAELDSPGLGQRMGSRVGTFIHDTTVFKLSQSLDPAVHRRTFNNYQHTAAIKYGITVHASGYVVDVSDGYPGATSDDDILLHSNVLSLMGTGRLLLDRGYVSTAYTAQARNIATRQPTFLRNTKDNRMTSDQANTSSIIANPRVVVERVIGRAKQLFPFIKKKVTAQTSDIHGAAVRVAFRLTNYWLPLLDDTAGGFDIT